MLRSIGKQSRESVESVLEKRAGFKGRANWAIAQGHPQLRGLHKKTEEKKLLPKET